MTTNKRWLMEWVDHRHIRTFLLIGESHYEPIRPHGNEVYTISEVSETAQKNYWKEWIGRTGYLDDDTVDVCFLFPADMKISSFIQAAESTGIKFANFTEWSIGDIVDYISQSGRKIKNVPSLSQSAILAIDLADGQHIFACCANQSEFLSNAKSNDVDFSGAENLKSEHEDAPISALNADKTPLKQAEVLPQATTQEIRDAMRRVANRQCKTIDYER